MNKKVQDVFQSIAEEIYDKVESGEFNIEEYKLAITKFNFTNNQINHFPLKRSTDNEESKCKC